MALEARGSTMSKLHDHQLDAIALLLAGERVIQRIQTGGGKTLVIILLIADAFWGTLREKQCPSSRSYLEYFDESSDQELG